MKSNSSGSVFVDINEVKFVPPSRGGEPADTFERFLTQRDAQKKENVERELLAEAAGVETRAEQVKRREAERQEAPVSSHRPASLPPPLRSQEENEEMPSLEDEFYTKKREFRRNHRKEEQIGWSRTNVELLSHRKERRELQRESEAKKRERELEQARLEQELKEAC